MAGRGSRIYWPLLGCFALLPGLSLAESDFQDAAYRDWVQRGELPPDEQKKLPEYCPGGYVEPLIRQPAEEGRIEARAARAEKGPTGSRLAGNASFTDGRQQVAADNIHLDPEARQVTLDGRVSIRQPGLLVHGTRGWIDLESHAAELHDVSLLAHAGGLRSSAGKITRTEAGNWRIDEGSFTRCGPGKNAWSITGRSIEIDPDSGFGKAQDLVLRLGRMPLAWLPWLRFPLDDRRVSGFLTPGISHDSEGGLDLSLPYYFNLAPGADATYTLRSLAKRGLVHEGQLRFLTAGGMSEINAGYIKSDDIFKANRQDAKRWYANLRHQGGFGDRFASRIRYSAVSDPDYLEDIGADLDLVSSEQYFGSAYSSYGDRRTRVLDRLGQIEYRGHAWNYLLRLQSFQHFLGDEVPEGYQRMPQLLVSWQRRHGKWRPAVAAEAVRFVRDNRSGLTGVSAVSGERLSLVPSVTLSLRSEYAYLKPRFEVDYRRYFLDGEVPRLNSSPEFLQPGFSLDSGLYFDRFFAGRGQNWQQTLEPRLFYLRRLGSRAQNQLPLFDTGELTPSYDGIFRNDRFFGRDRVGDSNQLSVGLTQRLINADTGREKLRFSLGRIWYFADRDAVLAEGLAKRDPLASRSPLFAELFASFQRHWMLRASLEAEPSGSTHQSSLSLRYNRADRTLFNFSYRRTGRDLQLSGLARAEASSLSFVLPLGSRWGLVGLWDYGWERNETVEALAGVEYNDCCWRTRVFLRHFLREPQSPDSGTRENTAIYFEFQMKGLGSLGRNLDRLLDNVIVGYRQRGQRYAN